MMTSQKQRKWATAITISSFFLTGFTGLLIFFELVFGGVRALHEWMSIAFVLGAIAHIFVNLKMFKRYFVNARSILAGVTVIGLVVFTSAYNDIYVAERAYEIMINLPLNQVLELTGGSMTEVEAWLRAENIKVDSWSETVNDVAKLNDTDGHHVLEIILGGSKV